MINELIKRKSQSFRSNCLHRAKKAGHDVKSIPMPKDIAAWLQRQPMIVKRKRLYFSCYLTNELVPVSKIEIDHRVPVCRCGDYSIDNLGITSARINQAKGMRSNDEFLALLQLIATWDDKGASIIKDLRAGASAFRNY